MKFDKINLNKNDLSLPFLEQCYNVTSPGGDKMVTKDDFTRENRAGKRGLLADKRMSAAFFKSYILTSASNLPLYTACHLNVKLPVNTLLTMVSAVKWRSRKGAFPACASKNQMSLLVNTHKLIINNESQTKSNRTPN